MDATTTNALWYLAVAAVLILICDPPKHRSTRVFDGVVLALCATSGVFAFALAPLAFVYRRWHRRHALPWWMIAILTAGAALQSLSLLVLQYHLPSGFQGGPRGSYPLHPSISLFFEIVGRRVILDAFGAGTAAPASTLAVLFGVLGAVLAFAAFRSGSPALRLFLAFATAMLVLSLIDPSATWSDLAVPGVGGRYFMIPQLATAAIVVRGVASHRQLVRLPAPRARRLPFDLRVHGADLLELPTLPTASLRPRGGTVQQCTPRNHDDLSAQPGDQPENSPAMDDDPHQEVVRRRLARRCHSAQT